MLFEISEDLNGESGAIIDQETLEKYDKKKDVDDKSMIVLPFIILDITFKQK